MQLLKRVLPLLGIGMLAVGTGCTTVASYQRANTLGHGNMQWTLEPGVLGAGAKTTTVDNNNNTVTHTAVETLPSFSAAYRYGVTDRIDLGARIGTSGIELLSKFQLTDSNGGLIVSLAPSMSGFLLASSSAGAGFLTLSVPLLLGVPVGEHQFVFGPKLYDAMVFGAGNGGGGLVNALLVGGSVGFALQITPRFQLMPDVAVLVPVVGSAATSDGSSTTASLAPQGVIFQAGVALTFGAH